MDKLTINKLRMDTKMFKDSVDTMSETYSKLTAKDDYTRFLRNKISNTTRANIALHELDKSHLIMFPICHDRHLNELEKMPEVDKLLKESDAKIQALYPKTAGIRKRLIDADRIVFDRVKPSLKGLKKELLKLRVMF